MSNTRPSKAQAIMEATERLMCLHGYGGFAIRDVAQAVGIRTAAVHYHFTTKADLACAVLERYRTHLFENLGHPHDRDPVQRLTQVFSDMQKNEGRICLCARLSAEVQNLPNALQSNVQDFNQALIEWLEHGLLRMDPHSADQSRRDGALRTYSLLVGAMTLAKAQNNPEIFERCVTLFSMERWRQRRAQSLSNPTSSPTLPT